MKLNELLKESQFDEIDLSTVQGKLEWLNSVMEPEDPADPGTRPWRLTESGQFYGNGDYKLHKSVKELPFKLMRIDGSLTLHDNKFKNLNNFPVIDGRLLLKYCDELESLEGIQGCHELVIWSCKSLKNLPKQILSHMVHADRLQIQSSSLQSLVGFDDVKLPEIGQMHLQVPFLKEGGLGLINVPGLHRVDTLGGAQTSVNRALAIIEKYLGRPEDLFECQAELIDQGLEEFAKL